MFPGGEDLKKSLQTKFIAVNNLWIVASLVL